MNRRLKSEKRENKMDIMDKKCQQKMDKLWTLWSEKSKNIVDKVDKKCP